MKRIGQYLQVEKLDRHGGRKTDVWNVLTNDEAELGQVRWFGRWRGYTFQPHPDTIFNHRCLTDLAAFLADVNMRHRAIRASRTAGARVFDWKSSGCAAGEVPDDA